MNNLLVVIPAAVAVGVFQTSLFEWVYHRYWLHRPWLPPQMFTAHTLVHHQLCKHDDTFEVHEEEQEEALTFQWWAAPIIVGLNMIPWAVLLLASRFVTLPALPWNTIMWTVAAVVFAYYLSYEGFHYLMHKPSVAWIERRGFFQWMKNHHRLHHVYMGKNFNVVLPLADWMLGTLVLADPLPPKPTGAAAREVARRHSKFGERLRAEAAHGRSAPESRSATRAEAPVYETVPPED
ncbi:MAG: sterol desaturase family protein [Candidatus Eisenbacteria bacterium]